MTIDDVNKIDGMYKSRENGEIVMFLIDYHPWEDDTEFDHKLIIKNKIENYVEYILSGQILNEYDVVEKIKMELISKEEFSESALEFFEDVKIAVRAINEKWTFSWKKH